jgi:hypothetical protein
MAKTNKPIEWALKNRTRIRWVAIEGSIFSEEEYIKTFERVGSKRVRLSIAFNVGEEVARHIVQVHNGQTTSAVSAMGGTTVNVRG